MAAQPTLLEALQLHPDPAVTLTLPLPPVEPYEALPGEIEYEHAGAGGAGGGAGAETAGCMATAIG
jgi:hypothetical protein